MIEGITGKKVTKQVRKIAKKNPDFVYTNQGVDDIYEDGGCSYFGRSYDDPETGQGCIVGQALQELGITKEEMRDAVIEGLSASEALNVLGISSKTKHDIFLDIVQTRQDNGDTWKKAVEYANEVKDSMR